MLYHTEWGITVWMLVKASRRRVFLVLCAGCRAASCGTTVPRVAVLLHPVVIKYPIFSALYLRSWNRPVVARSISVYAIWFYSETTGLRFIRVLQAYENCISCYQHAHIYLFELLQIWISAFVAINRSIWISILRRSACIPRPQLKVWYISYYLLFGDSTTIWIIFNEGIRRFVWSWHQVIAPMSK